MKYLLIGLLFYSCVGLADVERFTIDCTSGTIKYYYIHTTNVKTYISNNSILFTDKDGIDHYLTNMPCDIYKEK